MPRSVACDRVSYSKCAIFVLSSGPLAWLSRRMAWSNPQPPVPSFEHPHIAATTATKRRNQRLRPNSKCDRGPWAPFKSLIQPHRNPRKRRSIARLQPRAESPPHARAGRIWISLATGTSCIVPRPRGFNSRCGKANFPRRHVLVFQRDEDKAETKLGRWPLGPMRLDPLERACSCLVHVVAPARPSAPSVSAAITVRIRDNMISVAEAEHRCYI